jgi:hypothetical protein
MGDNTKRPPQVPRTSRRASTGLHGAGAHDPGGGAASRQAAPAIFTSWQLNQRHLRFASVRAYIPAMNLKFWQKALREAELEIDAATLNELFPEEEVSS